MTSLEPAIALLQSLLLLLGAIQGTALAVQPRLDAVAHLAQRVMIEVASSTGTHFSPLETMPAPVIEGSQPQGGLGYACPPLYALYNSRFGYQCQPLGITSSTTVAAEPCTLGSEGCIDVQDPPDSYLSTEVLTAPPSGPYTITNRQEIVDQAIFQRNPVDQGIQ